MNGTVILAIVLFLAYRNASSKLAGFAVGCGSLMVPAFMYNWIYGIPRWSPDQTQPTVLTVLIILCLVGFFMGCLFGGIALIRDAWLDKPSPR